MGCSIRNRKEIQHIGLCVTKPHVGYSRDTKYQYSRGMGEVMNTAVQEWVVDLAENLGRDPTSEEIEEMIGNYWRDICPRENCALPFNSDCCG